MRRVYNQKNLTITIDGITVQDYFEGASIVYTLDGGEVDKTQGTDGAGINLATNQGSSIQFTIRETSRSRDFLNALRLRQENGGPGVTVVLRTGADVLHTMTDTYIGREGQLTSGDKKQGGLQYSLMTAEEETSNMAQVAGSVAGGVLAATQSITNF